MNPKWTKGQIVEWIRSVSFAAETESAESRVINAVIASGMTHDFVNALIRKLTSEKNINTDDLVVAVLRASPKLIAETAQQVMFPDGFQEAMREAMKRPD